MASRVITALVGGSLVVSLVVLGGPAFSFLLLVISTAVFLEFAAMYERRFLTPLNVLGVLFTWGLVFGYAFSTKFSLHTPEFKDFLWVAAFLLLFFYVLYREEVSLQKLAYVFLGAVYIGLGFHYFYLLRVLPDTAAYALFVAFVVWATDIGAFLAGRLFGRHKLLPNVSPKKTWEGSLGGFVLGVLVALLAAGGFRLPLSLGQAFLLGGLLSFAGQIGDLIESAIKRAFQVKDSGHLLPGHGGFFDRFDSMIVAYPIAYFFFRFLGLL
ncbi:MAG: Phosphatidate cytidylyltransferase [Brockia lithotrophica]|uniref:Phosphatidate cytidylyltransferase n=1 Tax=Brockia lithotrophica TaxID=933949 RepID=A0A2T5G8Z3_9BACL|nr:phosphatidate cytidylyltransferase [Brockia lithotrophica]PTQ52639.1 MAG: Phosphatidate cytidylyltransferase [Brockia lithotrophica]